MNNVIPFTYNSKTIRIVTDDTGNPWWVAKDVCTVLGIVNSRQAAETLDDDEKGVCKIDTLGGNQDMVTINEPGLYTLIIRSNKDDARPFKRWVTHEVLPTLRKKGSYQMPNVQQRPATLLPIDREFRAAVRMAKAAGLKGNQAVLSANMLTRKLTGSDPLALLDMTHLTNEHQQLELTPSDIGKHFGVSGQKTNQILSKIGFQKSTRDSKNRIKWEPTRKGRPYSVLKDTGKRHSDGSPILQLFWLDSAVDFVRKEFKPQAV